MDGNTRRTSHQPSSRTTLHAVHDATWRLILSLLLTLSVAACSVSTSAPTPTETPRPSPALSAEAKSYLDGAIDWIEANALYRARVADWTVLRRRAYLVADGAITPADTYDAIRYVLYALADRHSHFIDPASAAAAARGDSNIHPPNARRIDGGVGYLELPGFSGDPPLAIAYATTAQREIAGVDDASICGWIVDLRTNPGGNVWPMIAGVGPILGEDKYMGAFVSPGAHVDWGYEGGSSWIAGQRAVTVETPYALHRALPTVAVLTGGQTASAGEAVVVAFRARPATRSFGEPTAGVPTANQTKALRDGAVIALTTALLADRTGQTYDHAIAPDEVLVPPVDEIAVAAAWLHEQPACRS